MSSCPLVVSLRTGVSFDNTLGFEVGTLGSFYLLFELTTICKNFRHNTINWIKKLPTWLIIQIFGIFRRISLSFKNTMTTKRLVTMPQVDIKVWSIFIRSVLSPASINSTVVVAIVFSCVAVGRLDVETFSKISELAIVKDRRKMPGVFTAPGPFQGVCERFSVKFASDPFYFWYQSLVIFSACPADMMIVFIL